MKQPPKKIYLQWHGDGSPDDIGDVCESEATWCKDKIFVHDVEYERVDESEIARLRKAIEDAPCSLGCVYHSCNQSPPCNCHALKHSDFCWKSKALGEQK